MSQPDPSFDDSFDGEFMRWVLLVSPELKRVFEVLKNRLSDEPELLVSDLKDAESYNARVSYILAQANTFVSKGRLHHLPGKDQVERELERKVILEANTAPIVEFRDKIETLVHSLKVRISLGQSLLSYQKQFIEPK